MKAENLAVYLNELNTIRHETSVEVYEGLEVDFVPGRISPSQFKAQLDYTIGSIHFVHAFADGTPWEIDSTLAHFKEGLHHIFDNDVKAAVTQYLALTRQMVEEGKPDIVGHLDKIKMHNTQQFFFDEHEEWYQREMRKTLDTIAANGCIIEINTRGLYQKKTTTTYPSPWLWPEIQKRNIPITLNSDAHLASDLTNGFPSVAQQLAKAGFKKLRILSNGSWKDASFGEHGIAKDISHHPVVKPH